MTAGYKGFGNNVDFRKSVPLYGARQKPDMEKLYLIDFTLEDDNLLPSTTTPDDINSQPLGYISSLSPKVVTENIHVCAKEQESTVSGSMERSEGKMLIAAAVNPSASCTVSRSDTETVLQDGQQDLEHGSHLNGSIHERFQELSGAERSVTDLAYLSGNKSRSARASSNLRRSLAWDKAFSTDEGVLDVDELPLVTKTPRKPQELHPFHMTENLGKVSPSPLSVLENFTRDARAVDRAERITYSPVQGPNHPVCLPCGEMPNATSPVQLDQRSDLLNSLTIKNASSKGSSLAGATSDLDTKTSKLDSKRSVSVGEIIKADVVKGTRLRLPSTFTGERGKSDMPPKPISVPQSNFLQRCKSSSSVLSPSSASSAFSKKVSSVSKKVKDTLGKVLPGSLGGSAKHFKVNEDRPFHQGQAANNWRTPLFHRYDGIGDNVNSPGPKSVARSKSSRVFSSGNSLDASMIRKKDAQVQTNNQELILADQLGNGSIVPSLKGSSIGKDDAPSSTKGTEKRSSYYTQVSPMVSRKKSEPAGSQVPPVENSNHVNAFQNSSGLSSGLRLPSPKIGFFDTHQRPASGEHPSTLPERVPGAASDNSSYSRKGLPPRPQHGLPSGRAGKPCADSNIDTVVSQFASCGIPSAPHLRPFGQPAKGLASSVSAPTSPRRHHFGMLSAASHHAVTARQLSSQTNSQFHSSISELKTRTLLYPPFIAFQNHMLKSSDCQSDQPRSSMRPLEVDPQPQVMEKPSNHSSTGLQAESGSLGGFKSPSEVTNSLFVSTKPPEEQSLSTSLQLAGLMEKSCSDCRLQSVVEDILGAGDSGSCREKAGNVNVIDELIISSSIEPLLDTVYHKVLLAKLNGSVCQEFDRVGGAQLAVSSDFGICSGNEILEASVAHPAREKSLGSRECHAGIAKLEFGRRLGPDSRLKSDNEIEDSSKFPEGDSSVKEDISCCAEGKLILEGNQELSTKDFKNIPGIGKRQTISSAKFAIEEWVQEFSSCSSSGHPENEYMERNNENSLDCPSLWSDWPFLAAANKPSSQASLVQEHTASITPAFKRSSYTATLTAENIQETTPESFVRSSSPACASDSQCFKHPLGVNGGLLNGISKQTSLAPLRKERNLQVVFDHPASETTSGQENRRVSDGQVGSIPVNKPQQRKSDSSYSLGQSEAYRDLFSEERLRALEAAGQESLLKKSGAVQHSPPNKISPNRNPWSPVKRSGQQLGPFDCTKKYTNVFLGQ